MVSTYPACWRTHARSSSTVSPSYADTRSPSTPSSADRAPLVVRQRLGRREVERRGAAAVRCAGALEDGRERRHEVGERLARRRAGRDDDVGALVGEVGGRSPGAPRVGRPRPGSRSRAARERPSPATRPRCRSVRARARRGAAGRPGPRRGARAAAAGRRRARPDPPRRVPGSREVCQSAGVDLSVSTRDEGGRTVVAAIGEVDVYTAPSSTRRCRPRSPAARPRRRRPRGRGVPRLDRSVGPGRRRSSGSATPTARSTWWSRRSGSPRSSGSPASTR